MINNGTSTLTKYLSLFSLINEPPLGLNFHSKYMMNMFVQEKSEIYYGVPEIRVKVRFNFVTIIQN